jgi:hypothetical protein
MRRRFRRELRSVASRPMALFGERHFAVTASLDEDQRSRIARKFGMRGLEEIFAHGGKLDMRAHPPTHVNAGGRIAWDLL